MGTYALKGNDDLCELVNLAYSSDEPVLVFSGDDECLVAMRPAVFERILFDSDLLNFERRETLRL